MNLDRKIRSKKYKEVWQQYCGFLDLSLSEYMDIQKRLMEEQLELYKDCKLGRKIIGEEVPNTVEEFRAKVPLTSYIDYADILLAKEEGALPAAPVIWIETTWEGGTHPVKVAPYTQSMIDHHRGSVISSMILATSDGRGRFTMRPKDNFLFGMAPLPFFTGIIPYAIEGELSINFMPKVNDAARLSFGQRNKEGFRLGLVNDIDLFFGMSGVMARMSEMFPTLIKGSEGKGQGTLKTLMQMNPKVAFRFIRAYMRSKETGCEIRPKDIWKPKGLMCGGTDSACFKKKIENYWGTKPLELFGGTEPTCIATEIWSKEGLVFFPDICFYEFIPENEMEKSLTDPTYQPRTFLMNEVVAGEKYELVISNFKGGVFMRYRVGDMFRCISTINEVDQIAYPQFEYIDRIPTVIDIAGFTRITENTILKTLSISNLDIHNWFAIKRYDSAARPYMHLYAEMGEKALMSGVVAKQVIQEHLSTYFKYIDVDYQDLKKMLGIDPLVVSIIQAGTIEKYEKTNHCKIRKINPSHYDVVSIERMTDMKE